MSDINTFKQKLEGGSYSGIAGARRAIGKFHGVSDADRAKMQELASKHFGAEDAAAKPAKATAPVAAPSLGNRVAKKVSAKKSAKPVEEAVAAPAVVAAPVKATRKKKAASSEQLEIQYEVGSAERVADADRTLQSISRATADLLRISEANVDVKAELDAAKNGINAILRTLCAVAEAAAPPATLAAPVIDGIPTSALSGPSLLITNH